MFKVPLYWGCKTASRDRHGYVHNVKSSKEAQEIGKVTSRVRRWSLPQGFDNRDRGKVSFSCMQVASCNRISNGKRAQRQIYRICLTAGASPSDKLQMGFGDVYAMALCSSLPAIPFVKGESSWTRKRALAREGCRRQFVASIMAAAVMQHECRFIIQRGGMGYPHFSW